MPEKIIYDIVYGVVRREIEGYDTPVADQDDITEAVQNIVATIVDSVNVAAGDAQYVALKVTGGDAPWPNLQRPLRPTLGHHRGN